MAAKESWKLPPGPDCDFLIVGKTGNGKSSTGNSILGIERFLTSFDAESATFKCDLGTHNIDGRVMTVLDTPGLCDTRMDDEESKERTMNALDEALRLCPQGFHTILVVIKFGERMTPENIGAIRDLENMLGGNMLREHGIIVFTGGDSFVGQTRGKVTFGQWCRAQRGPIHDILEECQYRCVLFDNITLDDTLLNRQRCELVQLVEKLAVGGKRYTSPVFEAAKEGWRLAQKEGRNPKAAKDLYLEAGQIYGEINQAIREEKYHDRLVFENLTNRLDALKSDMSQMDENSRARMHEAIQQLRNEMEIWKQSEQPRRLTIGDRFRDFLTSVFFDTIMPALVDQIRSRLPLLINSIVRRFLGPRDGQAM